MPTDDPQDHRRRPQSETAAPTDYTHHVRRKPKSEAAWRNWCEFVYPRVYYAVYRMTGGDRERTADLTQGAIERFLRYEAVERVTTDADSIAYLVRTAERMNVDLIRESIVRRSTQEVIGRITYEQSPSEADEVSDTLDLERLIRRLGKPDRQLIEWLRAGASVSQIAEILGISYSAAATRLHRAKARLRDISEDL